MEFCNTKPDVIFVQCEFIIFDSFYINPIWEIFQ